MDRLARALVLVVVLINAVQAAFQVETAGAAVVSPASGKWRWVGALRITR
jgi:hypothetical protein